MVSLSKVNLLKKVIQFLYVYIRLFTFFQRVSHYSMTKTKTKLNLNDKDTLTDKTSAKIRSQSFLFKSPTTHLSLELPRFTPFLYFLLLFLPHLVSHNSKIPPSGSDPPYRGDDKVVPLRHSASLVVNNVTKNTLFRGLEEEFPM